MHAVQVVEVVFEVELVEPEGGEEGGEVGRLGGRAEQGEGEIGPLITRYALVVGIRAIEGLGQTDMWREGGPIQEYLFLPFWRSEAIGYQRAERQRIGFTGTSWIGAEAGNSGGTGCGDLYDGIGGVHDLIMVLDSKGVQVVKVT